MYWHCDEELDLDHSWDLMDVLSKLEKDYFYTFYYITSSVTGKEEQIKSCAVIGYPKGQDGAILPARDYPLCPARKFSPKAM